MADPNKLTQAIDKVLAGQTDPWTDLCIAAVHLGHALAQFDNARRRYVASKRAAEVTATPT
jgi:hypothetical protein